MSLHLQAIAFHERGDLEEARGAAERYLQLEALDHTQFGDGLLLLSTILCSMQLFDEAERMAATCHGYLCEHLGSTFRGVAAASLNRSIILLERYYRTNDLQSMVHRHTQRRHAHGHTIAAGASMASLHGQSSSVGDDGNSNAIMWVVNAKTHLEEALSVLQDTFGVDRLLLADVFHNLGCCDEILGAYAAAMEHYMRALKIREKFQDASGTTDLKLAQTMEHIAMVYRLTESKLPEAQKLLGIVANTRRRYLGPHHPSYAAALFAQGVCAFEGMHLRNACILLRKAHHIRAETLGPLHPETVHVRKYLDDLYRETGWKEARVGLDLVAPPDDVNDAHSNAAQPAPYTAAASTADIHATTGLDGFLTRGRDDANRSTGPAANTNTSLQAHRLAGAPPPPQRRRGPATTHEDDQSDGLGVHHSRRPSTTPNESVELDIRPMEDVSTSDYFQPMRRSQTATSSVRAQPTEDGGTPLERALSVGSMPPLHPRSTLRH